MTRMWPLAGREPELTAIGAALAATGPGGVVLSGSFGVGKTCLARKAIASAASAGRDTEWVAASRSAASIPFGAVSRLLAPDALAGQRPFALLRASADHLVARAGPVPVVLGVDDAHLLDDASAALLQELMLRGAIFLIATVTAGAPVPDAITALCKDGFAERIRLRPLPAGAVDELLSQVLGPWIEGVSRRQIHRVTEGNPLLLRELLADALDTAALIRTEGVWRWADEPRYGPSLVELIQDRLPGPDDAARVVLDMLALGGQLPIAMIDRLIGDGVLDAGAVEQAENLGFVTSGRSGRRETLRLAHPVYAEIITATLSRYRASRVWRWLADAADGVPLRRRADLLRAATWQLRAGVPQRPVVLLAAARQATAQADLRLAEQFARAARRGLAGSAADHTLARILSWQGRHAEAAEALPSVPAHGSGGAGGAYGTGVPASGAYGTGAPASGSGAPASGSGWSGEPASWAVTRAWSRYWGQGQLAEAEQQLAGTTPRTPKALADIGAATAWLSLFSGDARRALEIVGPPQPRPAAAGQWPFPLAAAAFTYALSGRTALALALIQRELTGNPPGPGPDWGVVLLGWARCLALSLDGQVREAQLVAERGYADAVGQGIREMAAGWAIQHGVAALRQGRVVTADARLREALAALDRHDPYQLSRYALAELAGTAALAGDSQAAADWMRRCDAGAGQVNRMLDAQIELNRAWVLAAGGQLTAAVGQARQAADLARANGQYATEAAALYDVARLGKPRSVLARLTDLAPQLDGGLAPLLTMTTAALAAADGKALERSVSALDAIGLPLHAAEAASAAARAHREAGRQASANACTERARILAATTEGARTPLLGNGDVVSALTQRQREISMLAASGMPSKMIAARLWLSTRTVNNHLAHVYALLGVSSRAQLARVLNAPPATEPQVGTS
jgi:DNA-binding CsgD family transcriptional regulator